MTAKKLSTSSSGFCLLNSKEQTGGVSFMFCPLCGCTHVRPQRIRSYDITFVAYEFRCEQGHDFAYSFRFVNGRTTLELRAEAQAVRQSKK